MFSSSGVPISIKSILCKHGSGYSFSCRKRHCPFFPSHTESIYLGDIDVELQTRMADLSSPSPTVSLHPTVYIHPWYPDYSQVLHVPRCLNDGQELEYMKRKDNTFLYDSADYCCEVHWLSVAVIFVFNFTLLMATHSSNNSISLLHRASQVWAK